MYYFVVASTKVFVYDSADSIINAEIITNIGSFLFTSEEYINLDVGSRNPTMNIYSKKISQKADLVFYVVV